jgi:uncharacterized protein (DUF1697 family)
VRTRIALFRGINVGANRTVPMKSLCALIEKAGCSDVRSYIQSGNVVFRSGEADASRLARRIGKDMGGAYGFEPRILILDRNALAKAASGNPFAAAAAKNPKAVHLFFLAETPKSPDLERMRGIRAATEEFALKGRVFYLHTPDGFGKSKLAERAEQLLGVDATARNARTVSALLELSA